MSNHLFDGLFAPHMGNSDTFLHLPDGATISYDRFLRQAARFAHLLCDAGLKPGDRLAVQVEKSPDCLALYAGCVQAGIVYLPLNTAYSARELEYFLSHSGAAMFITNAARMNDVRALADQLSVPVHGLDDAGQDGFLTLAASKPDQFPPVARQPDDLAAILYTSGTTGRSKGAMMTADNLLSNARSLADLWQFTASDTLLHALPIFHTHGLFVATNVTLVAGSSMVFFPKFDPETLVDALPRATSMMGVPTFYSRLLLHPGLNRAATQHIRLFISGSAPLLDATFLEWEQKTGHRILERYGMTETNMITSNPFDGARKHGTVGVALPGVDVRVADAETGAVLPAGEVGQVELRGPNVFKGYWQDPVKTAEEFRDDGYFITGDLGSFDADGYLQIVGRSKDLVISGGYNIYPKEVELILDAHPDIAESAVFGVPHADLGEQVVAVVVPIAGRLADPSRISKDISNDLAWFKQPRIIHVAQELPRNAMGKVVKAQLRKDYAD